MTDEAKPKAVKKAAKKVVKKAKKEATPKSEYGVAYLSEKLDVSDTMVRLKLRNKKVKKTGKSYTWPTKAEADKIVSTLSG